jgi:hypothetical protein
VLQIVRLRNADLGQIRAGLETFEEHGLPTGTESFWAGSDGKTFITVSEVDDISESQKFNSLYSPYFESVETYVVMDGMAGAANIKAALDMVS